MSVLKKNTVQFALFFMISTAVWAQTPAPTPKSDPIPQGAPSASAPPQIAPSGPAARVFKESMLRGKEFLLEKQNFSKAIFPQDYQLGKLQGFFYESEDEGKAYVTMSEFLTSVLAGEIPEGKISLQWKPLISKILAEAYAQKPVLKFFRIGKIKWTDSSNLYANVSVHGEVGVARGHLYAERSPANGWLISDFQIDLAETLKPVEKRTEPYTPGAYEFLLGL